MTTENHQEYINSTCLISVTAVKPRQPIIHLRSDKISLGRSLEVDVCLKSNVISRLHAFLTKNNDGTTWSVVDNKSLNGVFVNSKKIDQNKKVRLYEGDIVQFGVPIEKNNEPEFIYKFCQDRRVRVTKRRHGKEGEDSLATRCLKKRKETTVRDSESSSSSSFCKVSSECKKLSESDIKTNTVSTEHETTEPLSNMSVVSQSSLSTVNTSQCNNTPYHTPIASSSHLSSSYFLANASSSKNKAKNSESKVKSSEKQLIKHSEPKKEHTEVYEQVKSLLKEKEQQDKELQSLKEHQEKLLQNFEENKKELKKTKDELESKDKEVKPDSVDDDANALELELSCCICSEMFVKAITLSCAHSFCEYCIKMWRRKKNECPICRLPITFQSRSVVLDNTIEQIYKSRPEQQAARNALIADRTAKMKKPTTRSDTPTSTTQSAAASTVITINPGLPRQNVYIDIPSDDEDNNQDTADLPLIGRLRCRHCGFTGHRSRDCPEFD